MKRSRAALSYGLVLSVSLASTPVSAISSRRMPLWGYVDTNGHVELAPTYASVTHIVDGDWVVVSREGKYGFLNLRTRQQTGLVFDGVADDFGASGVPLFNFGLEPVLIAGKWGYADRGGKIVIPARFSHALQFREDGLAIVRFGDADGFIDVHGRLTTPAGIDRIYFFHNGHAIVQVGDLQGMVDTTGRMVVPPRFKALQNFSANGLAPASLDWVSSSSTTALSHWGYIDRNGKFVIPPIFSTVYPFDEPMSDADRTAPPGEARVVLTAGEGTETIAFIDSSGAIKGKLPAGWIAGHIGRNGLIPIKNPADGKWGFAEASGRTVIPRRFESADMFAGNGLAAVTLNGRLSYIDTSGRAVLPGGYEEASPFDEHGRAMVRQNGRNEVIDSTGRVVAQMPEGTEFFAVRGHVLPFEVPPGQIDYPVQRFGAWTLKRTLYAVPKVPMFGPSPIGRIVLTTTSSDGLVEWSVSTDGAMLSIGMRTTDPSHTETRDTQIATFPTNPDELTSIMSAEIDGRVGTDLRFRSGNVMEQASQDIVGRQFAAGSARYKAELAGRRADFAVALASMQVAVTEEFGSLSQQPPCLPPQCVY